MANDRSENYDDERRTGYSWLLSLVLIVAFFFFGWAAKGYVDQNNPNSTGTPNFGVGGGPNNTSVSPTREPFMTETPTPIEPTNMTSPTGTSGAGL